MAKCKISSMVWISLSGGACKTIMTDPIRHIAQPSFPNVPSTSFKKYEPSTAPINTLKAPSGVTRIAGANAYAAKFATSPRITVVHQYRTSILFLLKQRIQDRMPAHHIGLFRYENPSPSKPCLSSASIKP